MTENKIVSIEEIDELIKNNKHSSDEYWLKRWKSSNLAILEEIDKLTWIGDINNKKDVRSYIIRHLTTVHNNQLKELKQSLGGGK